MSVPDLGKAAAGEACGCPHLNLGSQVLEQRNWSPDCALHGVGTEFFRAMSPKPFGYAGEGNTTRGEWLEFRHEETGDWRDLTDYA